MSEDHGRRVHDAIGKAVRDANPGSIVTAYALVIEATDGTDVSAYVYDAPEGQSVSTTLGLLDLGRRHHLSRVGDAGGEQ